MEKPLEEIWDELAKDMKVAVDNVFSPLKIRCMADKLNGFIDYFPPFYLEDKCNEMGFGVKVIYEPGDIPKYPLTCTSDCHKEQFIVESREDWENHVDKFITWKTEVKELINKIRWQ